jgi:pimeloyl-ACP methyl ester carboxylesterase
MRSTIPRTQGMHVGVRFCGLPPRNGITLRAGLNYYRANLPPEVLVGEVPLLEEKVTRPTLFIYGEKEQFVSQSVAEWTREFVEAPFTFRPIPQCGHCVQQEEPELVNQYILEFLADLKRE